MTNLELVKEVSTINERLDENIEVLQRLSQKQVKDDQIVVSMKDEVDRLRVEMDAVKQAINNVMDHLKNMV